MVRDALMRLDPGVETAVSIVKTTGDILSDAPLDAIGGKGVFVKEIERALLEGEIDLAVHSLKDMQAALPVGLVVSAYLEREDPRDMLFSMHGSTLDALPNGARVGTSSMRRRCQLKNLRPDLAIVDIRGNVPTRLSKVGVSVDAVVLAAAGVKRLGLEQGTALSIDAMVPSPGQGIIAIESRTSDKDLNELVARLNHAPTRICAEAERAFLAALGQDCSLPAGAFASLKGELISITGILGSTDEQCIERMNMEGSDAGVGTRLAIALKGKVSREERP